MPPQGTFYSWRHRNVDLLDDLTGDKYGRYLAGHAAKDIHEAFYLKHRQLPPKVLDRLVKAVYGLKKIG